MKKIILFLVVFALFGCVSKGAQGKKLIYGNQGLVVVSKKGGAILEKTRGYSNRTRRPKVPVFVLICDEDTVIWKEVPVEIYDKYNPGDTIKPL